MDGGNLLVQVRGWSRLWTFKRHLSFPLSHIKAVRSAPPVGRDWWKGWRLLGTHIPGVIVAGTFYRHDGREFWDVRDGSRAVMVELQGAKYRRLIVEVADPQATVTMINEALRRGAA